MYVLEVYDGNTPTPHYSDCNLNLYYTFQIAFGTIKMLSFVQASTKLIIFNYIREFSTQFSEIILTLSCIVSVHLTRSRKMSV